MGQKPIETVKTEKCVYLWTFFWHKGGNNSVSSYAIQVILVSECSHNEYLTFCARKNLRSIKYMCGITLKSIFWTFSFFSVSGCIKRFPYYVRLFPSTESYFRMSLSSVQNKKIHFPHRFGAIPCFRKTPKKSLNFILHENHKCYADEMFMKEASHILAHCVKKLLV